MTTEGATPRPASRAPLAVAVVHSSPEIFAGAVAAVDWARSQGAEFHVVAYRTVAEAAVALQGRDPVAVLFTAAPDSEAAWANLRYLCSGFSQLHRLVFLTGPEPPPIGAPYRLLALGDYGTGESVAGYLGHLMAAWHERETSENLVATLDLLASSTDRDELFRMTKSLLLQMAHAFHVDVCVLENAAGDGWPAELSVSPSHDDSLGEALMKLVPGGPMGERVRAAAAGGPTEGLFIAGSDPAERRKAGKFGVADFEVMAYEARYVWLSRGCLLGRTNMPAFGLSPFLRCPEEMNAVLALARRFFATFVASYAKLLADTDHRASGGEERRQQAIHQMVCGIAHEIKTPLGVVNTAAGVIRNLLSDHRLRAVLQGESAGLGEDISDATSLIQTNATRISDLIDKFKRVSVKQITDQAEAVDIAQCVRDSLEANRAAFGEMALTINVIANLDPGAEIWFGYPKQLEQVITNLLSNAFHHGYAGNGGPVEVALHGRVVGWKASYSLSITDYGTGIPTENQEKIFDAFFTTRRGDRYAGLGLTVVHNLVTDTFRGQVGVISEVGRGTTFHLEFANVQ